MMVLRTMQTFHLAALTALGFWLSGSAEGAPRPAREPESGLLFYAKADWMYNTEAIQNPYIIGGFFQIYWSQIEKENGVYDWSIIDDAMKPWVDAGKKVVLRIFWSANGGWPAPVNKTPTPEWVWDEGAKYCFHEPTQTQIPLMWDPIYKKYAFRFLDEMARKYDDNENILIFDITPGGETSPYRFSMNRSDETLMERFKTMEASDGTQYSDELWFETCKEFISYSMNAFQKLPLLVTPNNGGIDQVNFTRIGDFCVENGVWIGQNGLSVRMHTDPEEERTQAVMRWEPQTIFAYEMVAGAGGRTGTLMEVMQASERIGIDYVNVYPQDVLKGTPGNENYDPEYEEALKYGVKVIGPRRLAAELGLLGDEDGEAGSAEEMEQ